MSLEDIIVGITGASGIVYSQRLLQILNAKGFHIHLVISESGIEVIRHELAIKLDADNLYLQHLLGAEPYRLSIYNISDIKARISNGSFQVRGMVIVPCSMNTLGSIANGLTPNLISRAASVTLKEGRKLILVPRETPLTQIHLENMLKLARAGACILPAMPGFYHKPKTIADQIDFVVAKILDQLQIGHEIDIRYYENK